MNDVFAGTEWFDWIGGLLERPHDGIFEKGSVGDEILCRLKAGWGKVDTVELLKGLSAGYGDAAILTAQKFFEAHLVPEWAEIGKRETRPGTAIEDFIRVLWNTLTPGQGYEFSIAREPKKAVFSVTRCPVHELAKKTGLYDWLYALGCGMDYLITREFSREMGFRRTRTLIQDNDPCDHTYFIREAV